MLLQFPRSASELVYARAALQSTRQHFAENFFTAGNDTCAKTLNRDTSRGVTLLFMLGGLIAMAFVRDLLHT